MAETKNTIYVDGKDMVMGRLASFVAKSALNGNKVILFNCDMIAITGDKKKILDYYNERMHSINGRHKGPFWPRRPDNIVRRSIKRMLPYKRERGKNALKEIGVYMGMPKIAEGKELTVFEKARLPDTKKYIYVGDLSKRLGSTGWY